jgi:hypothetical protein
MLHPEIFLNRIEITLLGPISLDRLPKLVDDMLPVYAKHVKCYNDILPGNGPPFELLTLRLGDFSLAGLEDVPVPERSVHLVEIEGDVRFVNSEVARREAFAAQMRRDIPEPELQEFLESIMQAMGTGDRRDR